jgi:hypothetical protein
VTALALGDLVEDWRITLKDGIELQYKGFSGFAVNMMIDIQSL